MKSALIAILFCVFVPLSFAGEFQSKTIVSGDTFSLTVRAHDFLRIRNFTQIGGATRAVVSATIGTSTTPVTVLAATKLDSATLEPINSVIIAGPATVTVTPVASATLFITYIKKKDSD